MAPNFEGYLSSEIVRSNTSTSPDSGYKTLSSTPSLRNREYILGPPPVSAKRIKRHLATFQCTFCPKRYTHASNLRYHLTTHNDNRPYVCTVCGKAFARQHDRERHEGLHSEDKKLICKGELKQDGQWGCSRLFAHADALGRHFSAEAGRICIKPLLDEEVIERQRRWQEEQHTEHNIPKKQEPVSAFPVDEFGNYTFAGPEFSWSELLTVDDGYDGGSSGRLNFDYIDINEGYTALQPSIEEEISEEPAATCPSKEPDTKNTVLEGDCAAKIPGKSPPKDSTDENIEPPAIPEVMEEDQLVLTKISKQSEEPARESIPTNSTRRTEILARDEVSGDYDYLSATSTTESDFEDNESSEAETVGSQRELSMLITGSEWFYD